MGPATPFDDHELAVVRDYIERGGNLLVAVRPRKRTGLEKLLEEYSVKVGDNIIYDSADYFPPLMTNLSVSDFAMHDVNRSMVNLKFFMPECCTVEPVERRDPTWRIMPLARTGPNAWESQMMPGPDVRPMRKKDDRGGPLSLIVAVDKPAKVDPEHKRAKLDVWGSALIFTNESLRSQMQLEYVINHFRWLMDRSLLNIEKERISVKPLVLTEEQIAQLKWVVLLGFPLFGVALGLLAWFVRRK
jgi:ABC-type uncharacterized transport system involved in gliding motility auxiliary subunit